MKAVVMPNMMSSWTVVPQPHPAFNILSLSPLPKPSTKCLQTVLAANKTLNLFIFLLRIIIDYIQFSVFTLLKLRHLHIIQPVSTVQFSLEHEDYLQDYGALTDIGHVNVISFEQIRMKSNIIQRLTQLQSFYNSQQPGSNYEKVTSLE